MAGEDNRDRVVGDEERARAMLAQLKSVHAIDVGRDMVIAAVNYSYPKLGLSDETRPVRDLGDVRLSIELVRAILEVLDREHAGSTADLHDTLAQMQLAYAHAVQLANAERAAAHEAAPEPAREEPRGEQPERPVEAAPAAERAEPAAEEAPATTKSSAPGKTSGRKPAGKTAATRPAAKKAAPKKTAAKKKPAPRKKPTAEG